MISDPDFVSIDKRLTWFSSHIVTSRSNPFPGTSFAAPVAWRPATRPSRIREVRAMVSCHLATSRTHVTRVLVLVLVLASERRCERLSSSENTSPLIELTGTLPCLSWRCAALGLAHQCSKSRSTHFPSSVGGRGLQRMRGDLQFPRCERSPPSNAPILLSSHLTAWHTIQPSMGGFFFARGLQGTWQGCAPF